MHIRPTLAVWMKSQGLSDTQLAAAVGLSVDAIRKAKAGKPITRDTARKICKALDITLSDIEGLNY